MVAVVVVLIMAVVVVVEKLSLVQVILYQPLPMRLQLVTVVQEVMEMAQMLGQEKLDTLLHLTHSLLVVVVAVVLVVRQQVMVERLEQGH